MFICIVLDFAERGQYLEWNHEEEVFYRTDGSEAFTEEDRLREIFIDCIHGLEYCMTITKGGAS